jgi:hypothetical protein
LLPNKLGDLELPRAQENWKALLAGAFLDVVNNLQPGQVAVFLWDELPLMIYNIARHQDPNTAIELLDVLRQIRQTHHKRIRFVFTGSIGLHLVLRTLRRAGNANAPTNDMLTETVPPMGVPDAVELASRLLSESNCDQATLPDVCHAIADRVDGFPFYIHHLADILKESQLPITVAAVDDAANSLVRSNHDIAHFGYYVDRINIYYTEDEQALCFAILDAVAAASRAVSFDALANLVRHVLPEVEDDAMRDCLRLLREDQYLTTKHTKKGVRYLFRWRLVKDWWKENRL